jgi:hypothetical protein
MGLPLSIVSMNASVSRFCLQAVGDAVEDRARGRRGRAPGDGGGVRRVERRSTSSCVERATSQSGWPVMGETLVKYCPRTGARYSPPIQFS